MLEQVLAVARFPCIHRPKPESLAAVQILCVGFVG